MSVEVGLGRAGNWCDGNLNGLNGLNVNGLNGLEWSEMVGMV